MRKEHGSGGGKRSATCRSPGKKRITIMIDRDVIEAFRCWADSSGRGYQTLMNDVLRTTLGQNGQVRPRIARTLQNELLEAWLPQSAQE